MSISVVIPVYNETNRIEKSLHKVKDFLDSHRQEFGDIEILVVNDGSSDDTLQKIKKFDFVKVVSYELNRGKGYALRQGVLNSKYDFVYLCDADLSTPIEELLRLWELKDKFDCVIGSRARSYNERRNSLFRKFLGKLGNVIINFFLDLKIEDTQCGFKLLNSSSKEIFLKTQIDRWGYDFEFIYLLRDKGMSICELPVTWIDAKGSKLNWKGYISTFMEILIVWRLKLRNNKI